MEVKFTPGPWVVKNGSMVGHSDKVVIKNDDYFDWVCTVQVSNMDNYEANARLISAAPEMYELLSGILSAIISAPSSWAETAELQEITIKIKPLLNRINNV